MFAMTQEDSKLMSLSTTIQAREIKRERESSEIEPWDREETEGECDR